MILRQWSRVERWNGEGKRWGISVGKGGAVGRMVWERGEDGNAIYSESAGKGGLDKVGEVSSMHE